MKAFCLVCLYLTRQDWAMGYCRKKEHYIHKPHRNCAEYWESSNVDDDPKWMLKWHLNVSSLANEKYRLVSDFLSERSQFIEKGEPDES